MTRLLAWEGLDEWRAEVSEVELGADGVRARGTQIGAAPLPYRADYRLDAGGEGWATRALELEVTGEGWRRRLALRRDERGAWTAEAEAEGEPAEDDGAGGRPGVVPLAAPGGETAALAGALDCDLAFSPLTNLMPVRRLRLHEREGAETLLMAWVSLPDLAVHASRQHYTHVSRSGSGAVVRYESEARDFVADLELDRDGLVITYPQLARRVAG